MVVTSEGCGRGCCWHLVGGGQGCYETYEQPPTVKNSPPNVHSANTEKASSVSQRPQHPGVLDKFEDSGPGASGCNPDPLGRSLKALGGCFHKLWGCEHSLQPSAWPWLPRVVSVPLLVTTTCGPCATASSPEASPLCRTNPNEPIF